MTTCIRLFAFAFLLQAPTIVALPILSGDGSSLTGLEVPGYGLYDVMFRDGIVGDVYSGVIFDAAREAEANAVSAAMADALNALNIIDPTAILGCDLPGGVCNLFNPDSIDGELLKDNDVAYWNPAPPPPVGVWISGGPGFDAPLSGSTIGFPIATLVTYEQSVPTPPTFALLVLALMGVGWTGRKKL